MLIWSCLPLCSEDFFNVELRGKRKSGPSAETKSPPTEKRALTGDITHIDQDAETQPDQSVSEKKPAQVSILSVKNVIMYI